MEEIILKCAEFGVLGVDGSDAWSKINPILSVKDRKLLDYLHQQFDDQID